MKMGEYTQSKYAPLRDGIKKKIDSVCFERNRRQKIPGYSEKTTRKKENKIVATYITVVTIIVTVTSMFFTDFESLV